MLMSVWPKRSGKFPGSSASRVGTSGARAATRWAPCSPEFAERRGQAPWTEVWAANAKRSARGIAPFIESGGWLSAPFVDRAIARMYLARVLTETPPPLELCRLVLQFGELEAWLRELLQ